MRSSEVTSPQTSLHPNLQEVVHKHLATQFRKPYAQHTQQVFTQIESTLRNAMQEGRALILDSCCGTGESSAHLATVHPDALVIGIDKSAHRLGKAPILPANARVLHADVIDFWRLCDAANIHFRKLYLLYPNPYPKPEHLLRRWHGHPVFPVLLRIAEEIELRSNWQLYADEFAEALRIAGKHNVVCEKFQPDTILTPFERKYAVSGHQLWRVCGETVAPNL